MKLPLAFVLIIALIGCSSLVGKINQAPKQHENLSAIYGTLVDDKKLYTVVDTSSENEISDAVYSSLIQKLTYIDSLNKLYDIEWGKKHSHSDELLSSSVIDALCVGNIFLKNYHKYRSDVANPEAFEEAIYQMSMTYQPLYQQILEKRQQQTQEANIDSGTSLACLQLIEHS